MREIIRNSTIDSRFGWRSISVTDKGKVRKVNEDNCLAQPQQAHWAVADGMGGHQAGDLASQMIVNNLAPLVQSQFLPDFVDQIEDTLLGVNQNLSQLAQARDTVIGSTVVGAVLHQQHMLFYWVGDSRAYLLRKGVLTQLTVDHTLVQELVENNKITQEQALNHPEKNVITRAVGSHTSLFIDFTMLPIEKGDKYIICSDGIEKELNDEALSKIMQEHANIEECAQQLLSNVLMKGARDNVTFIIIEPISLNETEA